MTEKSRNEKELSAKIKRQNEYREEERTSLDKYKDQIFADDIPLKDLKIETEQEKNKHKTQNESQSTDKYQADFKRDKQ